MSNLALTGVDGRLNTELTGDCSAADRTGSARAEPRLGMEETGSAAAKSGSAAEEVATAMYRLFAEASRTTLGSLAASLSCAIKLPKNIGHACVSVWNYTLIIIRQ